jgi:hypothetical protein
MTNYDDVTDLTAKIQLLEKDILAHLGENAHLKMRNAELHVEVSTLRGYADRVECHLRDAKGNIVLLMSKIQECEARRY